MIPGLTIADIDRMGCSRVGAYDVACPSCGPQRRHALNRRRKVLRVWRPDPNFASWHCARCGWDGHTRDPDAARLNPADVERMRREAWERELAARKQRLGIAQFLWGRRCALPGSPGEHYLRDTRGYHGPIPSTIGFLPPRGDHAPAMITAFGVPDEPEPGVISIRQAMVTGVHVTRLTADGVRKAGSDKDKIMIGHSTGTPIVLAPMNDLLGLDIVEGIEKGLATFAARGMGTWVAGSASRMPALADAVPPWTAYVSVHEDDDEDGRRHAAALVERLRARRIAADVVSRPGN